MEVTRIFDIIDRYKSAFPEKEVVIADKKDGEWRTYNIDYFIEKSKFFSYGLLSLNHKSGSKIATISNNRPEWNFVDIGMMQAGYIHVPIYPTISTIEFEYIINHCKPEIILVSDDEIYNTYKKSIQNLKLDIEVYSFDEIENVKHWTEILELGKKNEIKVAEKLNLIKSEIKPGDPATIIYTSGTTGNSKGVVLSHHNFTTTINTACKLIHLSEDNIVLSFLPLCHVFERMTSYTYFQKGVSIYYAENTSTIGENLKELKVNGFTTVPRLLEKVYDRIIANGKDLSLPKKIIFFWALAVGFKFRLNEKRGFLYTLKLKIANKLVFSKWREALGGNIIFIGVAGAALQKRLATIFWAAGIPVYEGYGLTETSPIVSVNWGPFPNNEFPNIKLGSVGPVYENVEVKIADDGEIICRGPNVMLGYYNDEKATNAVLDSEGWFKTGDIGSLDEDNFLTITDRKKEIFKTSGGKYIAPQVIENIFKESEFIEQLIVVGENQKFPSAIILPEFTFLHSWAAVKKIKFKNNESLIKLPNVIERFQREVDILNQKLGQTEKIKKFALVHEDWSPKTGELSPTLKLKRKVLINKYNRLIFKIYQ